MFTAVVAQELWANNMAARKCVTLPDWLFHVCYIEALANKHGADSDAFSKLNELNLLNKYIMV